VENQTDIEPGEEPHLASFSTLSPVLQIPSKRILPILAFRTSSLNAKF